MDILLYILVVISVFCIGVFVGRKCINVDGLFIVNDSNYEKTKWIIDVKDDPNTIPNKKQLRLKVVKMDEGDV